MSSKFIKVVAVVVAGAAECAAQLGDFEVHCVGTSFEIGARMLASASPTVRRQQAVTRSCTLTTAMMLVGTVLTRTRKCGTY